MAVVVSGCVAVAVAVPVAVPVAGLTKKFFNQNDFLINVPSVPLPMPPDAVLCRLSAMQRMRLTGVLSLCSLIGQPQN